MPYHKDAKYICVFRNPKDVCVSLYHHCKMFGVYEFNGNFDDFFKCWMEGEVDYCSYADHVLSWWQHRHDPNILCMFYEEMHRDVRSAIKKIAAFLGPSYLDKITKSPAYLERIVKLSSFSHMRRSINSLVRTMFKDIGKIAHDAEFFRKGVVGDWQNYFSDEQHRDFDRWFNERFCGTGMELVWDEYGRFLNAVNS